MTPETTTPSSIVMLRLPEVTKRTGLGKSAIYKLIAAKKFPAPGKLGSASVWPEHEVDAVLAKVMDARPQSPAP